MCFSITMRHTKNEIIDGLNEGKGRWFSKDELSSLTYKQRHTKLTKKGLIEYDNRMTYFENH